MTKYLINYLDRKSCINKNIYGHFCEHLGRLVYDGIWVGKKSPIANVNGVRKDVVEALKQIKVPILRWLGGCFADTYHWKDAVGPREKRKPIVNRFWGGGLEDNSFGTHEFMDFCEEVGADAYISLNLGSGSIREMVEWAEYLHEDKDTPMARLRKENGREKPWKIGAFGIGNEVWGCGGQMQPSYYVNQFRQASHFVNIAIDGGMNMANMLGDERKDRTLMIASGPNGDDYHFTDEFMKGVTAGTFALNSENEQFLADGLSLHYYTLAVPQNSKNPFQEMLPADGFDEMDWYYMLKTAANIENIINRHDAIMTHYDPFKKVGLMIDEWGAWYANEPGTNPLHLFQQNTMRDAVLAAMCLNIFNKHSDRVHLTTIAQMVNVLQSIILTEGDKMVRTPTYYVYDMFKEHQNATLLGSFVEKRKIGMGGYLVDSIFESCSVDEDGDVLCTVCNTSIDTSDTIEAALYAAKVKEIEATILCADPHAKNTFDMPNTVESRVWKAEVTENGFRVELPAASVVSLKLKVCC